MILFADTLVSGMPAANVQLVSLNLVVLKVGLVSRKGLRRKPVIHVIAFPILVITITGNHLDLVTGQGLVELQLQTKAGISRVIDTRIDIGDIIPGGRVYQVTA